MALTTITHSFSSAITAPVAAPQRRQVGEESSGNVKESSIPPVVQTTASSASRRSQVSLNATPSTASVNDPSASQTANPGNRLSSSPATPSQRQTTPATLTPFTLTPENENRLLSEGNGSSAIVAQPRANPQDSDLPTAFTALNDKTSQELPPIELQQQQREQLQEQQQLVQERQTAQLELRQMEQHKRELRAELLTQIRQALAEQAEVAGLNPTETTTEEESRTTEAVETLGNSATVQAQVIQLGQNAIFMEQVADLLADRQAQIEVLAATNQAAAFPETQGQKSLFQRVIDTLIEGEANEPGQRVSITA